MKSNFFYEWMNGKIDKFKYKQQAQNAKKLNRSGFCFLSANDQDEKNKCDNKSGHSK